MHQFERSCTMRKRNKDCGRRQNRIVTVLGGRLDEADYQTDEHVMRCLLRIAVVIAIYCNGCNGAVPFRPRPIQEPDPVSPFEQPNNRPPSQQEPGYNQQHGCGQRQGFDSCPDGEQPASLRPSWATDGHDPAVTTSPTGLSNGPNENSQYNLMNLEKNKTALTPKNAKEAVELINDVVGAILDIYSGGSPPPLSDQTSKPSLLLTTPDHRLTLVAVESTPTNAIILINGSLALAQPIPSTTAFRFDACQSFAHILSSCASKTPSFYSLKPTAQASCACYTTSTPTACSKSNMTFAYATPGLSRNTFDVPSYECRNFLLAQGYSNVAQVLSSSNNTDNVTLGAGFCGNMAAKMVMKSNLDPVNVLRCKALATSSSTRPTGAVTSSAATGLGGIARLSLTGWDRAVLVIMPIISLRHG